MSDLSYQPSATTEADQRPVDQFVIEPLLHLWEQFVAHLPSVMTSVVVLVALYVVARIARGAAGRVLRLSRIDSALADTRLATMLNAFQKDLTASRAIAYLIYFSVVLLGWMTAADIVGLDAVRTTLEAILGYLPRLLSALLVIALGGWLAGLARRAVGAGLREIRSPYARLLEGMTELVLLIIVVTIAINVLGADTRLVASNLTIVIATIVVSIAFLVVWAMRRPAEHVIANYYLRRMLRVGDQVVIGERSGELSAFAPLGVLIRDEHQVEHFVPARVVFDGLKRTQRATR